MKLVMTTWIQATPERVYELFADVARLPERIPAILKIELLGPGPLAVGSKFKETRMMFGREATEEFTVTRMDPGTAFEMTANSCGMAYTARHLFASETDGTRVTLELVARPVSFFAWLMSPLGWLMKGSMQKAIQADLDHMKAACEKTLLTP